MTEARLEQVKRMLSEYQERMLSSLLTAKETDFDSGAAAGIRIAVKKALEWLDKEELE